MGTEKCPFCGQEIDAEATKCFFCGAQLNEESIHDRLEQLHEQDIRAVRGIHKHHLVNVLVILILIAVVLFYGKSGRKRISEINNLDRPSIINLDAKIEYIDSTFVVSNNDPFDWKNVELEIIPESINNSFTLRISKIIAGESFKANAMEFVDNEGIQYNPDKIKTKELWIKCDTPNESKGSYLTDLK